MTGRASCLRCAYCHEDFEPAEEPAACLGCATQYHLDCRAALRACASVGCRSIAQPALPESRPRRPSDGVGWTLVPWVLLPTGFFGLAIVSSGGWNGSVYLSLGLLSLVLPIGWIVVVGSMVALGLAGRR